MYISTRMYFTRAIHIGQVLRNTGVPIAIITSKRVCYVAIHVMIKILNTNPWRDIARKQSLMKLSLVFLLIVIALQCKTRPPESYCQQPTT